MADSVANPSVSCTRGGYGGALGGASGVGARWVCLCLGRREHIHEPQHPGTHEPIASSSDGEDVHCINIKVIVFALRNERRRAIK